MPHPELEDEEHVRTFLGNAFSAFGDVAELKFPAPPRSGLSQPGVAGLRGAGKGCGFGFMRGPYCSYATAGGVHVLFSGEVGEWPGIDSVQTNHDSFMSNVKPAEDDDAHWLLDFYSTFTHSEVHNDEAVLQEALECLSKLKGSFAFVIYDSVGHRVLAARDAEGAQPMYWGSTVDGRLLFGTTVTDLEACDPTCTLFPAGSLFASTRHVISSEPGPKGWVIEGDDFPGEVLSFVKADEGHWRSVAAIPRITSKGCVTGAVYKVSSKPDMEHPARA
ncbi:hypothetical protein FOA52_007606 [Chlamydomonas sp. UWO 241]|nr:hypothetical protein FOA52_007606 [Chlamydomonas sp. UWO 241]